MMRKTFQFIVLSLLSVSSLGVKYNFFAILDTSQPVDKPRCESAAFGNAVATFEGDQLCIRMNMVGVGGETLTRLEGAAEIGTGGSIKYRLPLGDQKIECISIADQLDRTTLLNGFMYINVRSARCPAGEIRGQLMRT